MGCLRVAVCGRLNRMGALLEDHIVPRGSWSGKSSRAHKLNQPASSLFKGVSLPESTQDIWGTPTEEA